MKVKKKYFLLGIVTVISLLLIALVIATFLLNKFGLSYADSLTLSKVNSLNNEEIKNYNHQLQYSYDVLHYNLNVELFDKEKKIKGETKLTLVPKDNFSGKVILNFKENFDILKFNVNNKNSNYEFHNDKLSFNIPKEEKQKLDTIEVTIEYIGKPENLGFGSFVFDKVNNQSVIYTLNEPIYASTWFPCNDIPFDKVLTDIYITNDSSKVSVSNGKLISEKIKGDKKTYHWKTVYPIATYLITIYSADYKYFNQQYISNFTDTTNIDYYVLEPELEKAKIDFSIHPEAMKIFSDIFGEYPFINEKYGVAEFTWNLGAIEHQTITGLGKDFISGRKFFTSMLVHELAHQWWGNAVTPKTWKDIWLNEGFATYSEALYFEKLSGSKSLQSTMVSFKNNFGSSTLYNPENLFSRAVYNKGAWVLHMLRKEVEDSTFFRILNTYYSNFKYKNASTEDFIKTTEQISNRDFQKFFKQWVYEGAGKIELEYSYDVEKIDKGFEVFLEVEQIQNYYSSYHFSLDVKIEFTDKTTEYKTIFIDSRNKTAKFVFAKNVKTIYLDPENWLAADIIMKN
ncbi:MAG: hypothetical protein CR986_01140 [Ignavibacteriae bacterium]|nr:MAG: hypothetical protein CR986_01140 [Ignavibacteriota bacterium]